MFCTFSADFLHFKLIKIPVSVVCIDVQVISAYVLECKQFYQQLRIFLLGIFLFLSKRNSILLSLTAFELTLHSLH